VCVFEGGKEYSKNTTGNNWTVTVADEIHVLNVRTLLDTKKW
jgi:hypothetical protein